MKQSRPGVALVASTIVLASCGDERIIAAYAVEKKNGEWCAVAEEARANALIADSASYPRRDAVLHFRESVLAWAEYTIEHPAGQIRDTFSFDKDYNVSRLTRTGSFDSASKLYVWYELGEDGRLALTRKSKQNIRAHRTAGHRTEWLSSPIYPTFEAMPFSDTVRVRSMKRTIRRAC